jgi:hypothetical protein
VHGDTVLYPLALVRVQIGERELEVEAAVSNSLPTSMLLGTDMSELMELLGEQQMLWWLLPELRPSSSNRSHMCVQNDKKNRVYNHTQWRVCLQSPTYVHIRVI